MFFWVILKNWAAIEATIELNQDQETPELFFAAVLRKFLDLLDLSILHNLCHDFFRVFNRLMMEINDPQTNSQFFQSVVPL